MVLSISERIGRCYWIVENPKHVLCTSSCGSTGNSGSPAPRNSYFTQFDKICAQHEAVKYAMHRIWRDWWQTTEIAVLVQVTKIETVGEEWPMHFIIYYCCILFLWNWSCYAWSIFLWVLFSCLYGPHICSYCFIVSSLSSELCHCVQSTISLWIQWIHCCWNMLEQSTAGRYVCAVGVVPKDMEVGSGMPLLIFMVFHTAAF